MHLLLQQCGPEYSVFHNSVDHPTNFAFNDTRLDHLFFNASTDSDSHDFGHSLSFQHDHPVLDSRAPVNLDDKHSSHEDTGARKSLEK